MKNLLLVLCLFCTAATANQVKCYNNGRLIYSRYAHDISYADDYLVFIEDYSSKAVMTSMDCIVKIDVDNL